MQVSGLSRLPDSLILKSLLYAEDHELYDLALVSRRIHELSLRLLLRRRGIDDPQANVEISMFLPEYPNSALRALRLALFVTEISCITCKFHHTNDQHGKASLSYDAVHYLLKLISKLSFVKELNLHFDDSCVFLGKTLWDIFNIFRNALDRKSCSRLMLTDTLGDAHSFTRTLPNYVPQRPSTVRSKVHNLLQPSTSAVTVKQPTTQSLQLTSIIAKKRQNLPPSDIVFPCLESLGLGCVGMSPVDSGRYVKAMPHTMPRLTSLVVDINDIPPSSLLLCISLLPRLMDLRLTVHAQHSTHNIPASTSLHFPSLTHLYSPPAYASVIISGMWSSKQLIDLHLLVPDRDEIFSREFEKVLGRIISPKTLHVAKSLVLVVNFTDDLSLGRDAMMQNLDVYFRTELGFNNRTLDFVQNVCIMGASPLFAAELTSIWLRKFRGLRHLEFTEKKPRKVYARAVYQLLHAIHTQSPTVQTVILREQVYDIKQTLQKWEHLSDDGQFFPDIPVELLEAICEHLTPREVYKFGQVSKKLRDSVLGIYLRARFIDDKLTIGLAGVVCQDNLNDISALMLSPLRKVRHISCILHQHEEAYVVFEALRRLERLILSSGPLDSLEFSAGHKVFGYDEHMSDKSKHRWSEIIISLCDAALQKSCPKLSIQGEVFFERNKSPPMQILPACVHINRFLKHRKSGNESDGPNSASLQKSRPRTLITLNYDARVLGNPFLQKWIASTLKSHTMQEATIRTLSFSVDPFAPAGISDVKKTTWLSLRISNSKVLRKTNFLGKPPHLDQLNVLTSSPELVIFLVGRKGTGLPRLHTLNLLFDEAFPSDLTAQSVQALLCTLERLQARNPAPQLQIHTGMITAFYIINTLASYKQWQKLSIMVTGLHFTTSNTSHNCPGTPEGPKIRECLEQLPAIKHLAFQGVDREHRLAVMKTIEGVTPSLVTLEINGEKQDISSIKNE